MEKQHFCPRSLRGVAAVEFALLLIPLLLMIFGTTELGRAIYTYNTLDKAVRDAVRHLSQHGPGDTTAQAQARCLAVYGNTSCQGSPLAPALGTTNVVLCDALSCPSTHAAKLIQLGSTSYGSMNLVSVAITQYSYNSAVEFVVPSMKFNRISATMRAQL